MLSNIPGSLDRLFHAEDDRVDMFRPPRKRSSLPELSSSPFLSSGFPLLALFLPSFPLLCAPLARLGPGPFTCQDRDNLG